jgi:hypothetical protein
VSHGFCGHFNRYGTVVPKEAVIASAAICWTVLDMNTYAGTKFNFNFIAMGYGLGFDSRRGQENILFLTQSRMALEPIQLPVWVTGALSLGLKRLGREAEHELTSSAEVKNGGAIPPLPTRLRGVVLKIIKHRENFCRI